MRRRGIGRPMQPSLVSTAARTAVVVGTASAVSGKVASNQSAKAAQASPSSPPAPAPADAVVLSDDLYEQLKKLGELRDVGILTDEEFQAKKTQLLAN